MTFIPDRDSQSSNDRVDDDSGSKPSGSRTAGVYDVDETAGERTVKKTGVYDQPVQKSGSMFSKIVIVAAVIIVGIVTFQVLF